MRDLEPQFPPELMLAVACAHWSLDELAQHCVRQRIVAELDWSRFLAWIRRHGIAPLAHRNLVLADRATVPEAVLRRLQDEAAGNARRVLLQLTESQRIMRALDSAGIRSMMIKGPALSVLAFGDPTIRVSRDVDLLVDPDRVEEADRLIIEAGYRRFAPDLQLTTSQFEAFQRMRCQFGYYSEELGVVQELHWRLTSNINLLPLDEAALWTRTEPVRVASVSVATLPDQALFLYLCTHGSVHVWFRLKWLADIAALLQKMSPDVIAALDARARSLGIGRSFDQALVLAHKLLAVPVPSYILARAMMDRTVRKMTLAAYQALNWQGSPSEPGNTRWFNLWVSRQAYRLKPGIRYGWAELQDQLVSPEDWTRMPLPESLSFLYLPLRPVSWGIRKVRQAFTPENSP